MSQFKSFVPKVGCPHFKSLVKQIKRDYGTFETALGDIIDNVCNGVGVKCNITTICGDNGSINEIIISDNLPNGFENALDEGSNNPFNMGHIREGHTEDGQTSEFGVGLKKSIVKLSNKSIIYTRSEKNDIISFLKTIFDIKEMCSKEDPNESYDPDFQFITEENFYEVHTSFTTGSTIILTNLLDIYRKTEIDELIKAYCSNTYSKLINDKKIHIKLNDEDIVCKEEIPYKTFGYDNYYEQYLYKSPCGNIYEEGTHYKALGFKKIIVKSEKPKKSKKSEKTEKTEFITQEDFHTEKYECIKISGFSTFGTNYHKELGFGETEIIRSGRSFGKTVIPSIRAGCFSNKSNNDGYSNYIHHKIEYTSKELNKEISIGSDKRIYLKPTPLIESILSIQQNYNTKWRKKEDYNLTQLIQPIQEIQPTQPIQLIQPIQEIQEPIQETIQAIQEIQETIQEPIQLIQPIQETIQEPIEETQLIQPIQEETIQEPIQEEETQISRESIIAGCKLMMEYVSHPDFNDKKGKEFLEYVKQFTK